MFLGDGRFLVIFSRDFLMWSRWGVRSHVCLPLCVWVFASLSVSVSLSETFSPLPRPNHHYHCRRLAFSVVPLSAPRPRW